MNKIISVLNIVVIKTNSKRVHHLNNINIRYEQVTSTRNIMEYHIDELTFYQSRNGVSKLILNH